MEDTIKNLLQIIPVIVSALIALYSLYKKPDTKLDEYRRLYYENVLEPFYYNCILGEKNVDTFFSENNLLEKHFFAIPTYIHSLVKANTNEDKGKLFMVLCVDFDENRPSEKNNILRALNAINKRVYYFGLLLQLILVASLLGIDIWFITTLILMSIEWLQKKADMFITIYNSNINILWIWGGIVIALVAVSVLVLEGIKKSNKELTYSLDKKTIETMINQKITKYDKMNICKFEQK